MRYPPNVRKLLVAIGRWLLRLGGEPPPPPRAHSKLFSRALARAGYRPAEVRLALEKFRSTPPPAPPTTACEEEIPTRLWDKAPRDDQDTIETTTDEATPTIR